MRTNHMRAVAWALCLAGCGGDPLGPPANGSPGPMEREECPSDRGTLTGTLARSCRLTADRTWRLRGQVSVPAGVTLTIEPGTVVQGQYGMPVSFLLVERGGRLLAEGTAERPIVFTSERPPGERAPGDWGGVVLKGRAHLNLPGGEGELEGEAGRYGGGATPDDNDSSGVLRYVRIEFAGRVISGENELNALTLGAVGRGTRIEYVQVHQALDDGFEMFGGSVDLRYCVATAMQDDAFDWDFGWTGRGQFLVAQQIVGDGNNGIEADNNKDNNDLMPLSSPTLYNVTLVGTGRGQQAMKQPRFGLTLRRGTAGRLHNLIVTGFQDAGMVMTEDSTARRTVDGQLDITHSLFYGNGTTDERNIYDPQQARLPRDPQAPTKPFDLRAWVLAKERMNREADPMLRNPLDVRAPDFRPQTGSPALQGARQPPADGFFTPVDYIGAVGPQQDWTRGWTAYPVN
ncbi:MAG: hypothetical protein RMK29_19875 [Myxococcales bacterium]|nr:hypothetical protein [Myxococcota bacterium]MDW8283968.1 hypothetical protein [Myxococcales bacterium]